MSMAQDKEKYMGDNNGRHGASMMYIIIVGVFFAVMTTVFVCLPRTRYSELEKRDLAEFPDMSDFNKIKENPGKFTADVSTWFSDTEPYRDELMTLSMKIRGAMKGDFRSEEETVSFRPADTGMAEAADDVEVAEGLDDAVASNDAEPTSAASVSDSADDDDINDGKAKLGSSGTIIVGKGDKVRALMAFGGSPNGGGGYVDLLNTLANEFPGRNVYAMIAPLATEFYLPEKAAKASKPQKPFIYSVRDRLSPKVKFVDVYDELSKHTKEDIYLRTDHHWAPLGGYYAAKRLASTAGVPFKGLDAYESHTIKNYVGTMYGYSKDISVKNAPEDFVYYTPTGVTYDAEFVAYTLNKDFKITKESKPYKASFFKKFKDGSSQAYLSFIGTDQAFVKVKTSTPGNRRLLIIKDSYGNAVPGNLFYSFNEVHVIDFRYFTHNLKEYVTKNGITDIAVCFNVFNAYSSGSASKVKKMLTQKGGIPVFSESKIQPSETTPETPKEVKTTPVTTQTENKSDETVTVEATETSTESENNSSEESNTVK